MNLSEKLRGLKRTIMILEDEKRQLEEQIEKEHREKIKFGDIVVCPFGKRVILLNDRGKKVAFNKEGNEVGGVCLPANFFPFDKDEKEVSNIRPSGKYFYTKTGKNIFEDSLLDLDI